MGFEPTIPFGHSFLIRTCMPFHHSGQLSLVPRPVSRGQSMAVRTQEPEVLKPIIRPDAIDVIELQGDGPIPPAGIATSRTFAFKEARREKPALEFVALIC